MPARQALLAAGQGNVCWRCRLQLKSSSTWPNTQLLSHSQRLSRYLATCQLRRASNSFFAAKKDKLIGANDGSRSKEIVRCHGTSSIEHDQSPSLPLFTDIPRPRSKIREKLRKWHADNRDADQTYILNDFQRSSINVEDRAVRTDEWPAPTPDDEDTARDPNTILNAFDRMSAPYEGMETLIVEFTRGDLVELAAKSGSSLAVFLTSNGDYNIFYAQDGSLRFTSHTGGLFRARKYFGEEALAPIMNTIPKMAYEAKTYDELRDLRTSIPLEQGAHILREMASFQKSSEVSYRLYSKIMDNLHRHVANDSAYKVMRIDQLADAVLHLANVDRSTLENPIAFEHAIIRAVVRHPFGFVASTRELVQHEELGIESLETAKQVYAACSWIRAYQLRQAAISQGELNWDERNRQPAAQANRVQKFLNKCRQLIAESRSIRPSNRYRQVLSGSVQGAALTPDADGVVHSLTFSDDDRCLIKFVKHACHQHYDHNPALLGLTAILLRATGAYDDVSESLGVDSEARRNFLVEIGVLQPFSMATAIDRDVIRAEGTQSDDYCQLQMDTDRDQSVYERFGLRDTMSDWRKDWGDMLVLAVDKAGTQVVDDGLSIEPILDEPGLYRLHIHISHISAWMPPDSILARMASNVTQSQYFCERSLPMLPRCVTKEHSIRKGGTVLSFSLKVNASTGEISDFTMQPGIVHNIEYADKSQVDAYLGLRDMKSLKVKKSMVVGNAQNAKEEASTQELSHEAQKTCALLHSIAQSMSKSLLASSEGLAANIEIIRPRHKISVLGLQNTGDVFSRMDEDPSHARFSTESPTILWSNNEEKARVGWNIGDPNASFDEAIQTFMMTAGLEAAKWATARKIPLPYVGSGIANESVLEQRDRFRTDLTRAADVPELMDHNITTKLWKYWTTKYGTRLISSKATPHRGYGISAYTKVTSPLRRYYDLLSMWQLDAALRHEHDQERSLVSMEERYPLIFSEHDMDQIIRNIEPKQRKQQQVRASSEKHWFCQMLARALHLKDDQLPQRMTALLGTSDGSRRSAYILELDFMGWVKQEVGDDGNVLSSNDVWEVEIDFVAMKSRLVWLRCNRKISSIAST